MKVVKSAGHTLKFYNGIKEMPMHRYNQMQSYLMHDAGIGSTMADIDQHMKNLDAYLSTRRMEEAALERQNLHFNFYSALEKISYKSLSFACLIYSIDGEVLGDSDDDMNEVIPKLSRISVAEVLEILDDLKKNCIAN